MLQRAAGWRLWGTVAAEAEGAVTHTSPKNRCTRGAGGQIPLGMTHGQSGNTLGSSDKDREHQSALLFHAGGQFFFLPPPLLYFAFLCAKPGPTHRLLRSAWSAVLSPSAKTSPPPSSEVWGLQSSSVSDAEVHGFSICQAGFSTLFHFSILPLLS